MKNETILITGATQGIGKALCRKLAKNNHVIALGRDSETLKTLQRQFGISP